MMEIEKISTTEIPPRCILSLGDIAPGNASATIRKVRQMLDEKMGADAPVLIMAGAATDQIQSFPLLRIPFDEERMSFRVETEGEKQYLIIERKEDAIIQ